MKIRGWCGMPNVDEPTAWQQGSSLQGRWAASQCQYMHGPYNSAARLRCLWLGMKKYIAYIFYKKRRNT